MTDFRHNVQGPEQFVAPDAQNNFLFYTMIWPTAIQFIGYASVDG
jgi:hypothetical protein